MTDQIISQEGYDKLKDELDHALNVKRKVIADRIQKAKDMGDLSENAEYTEAKDAQAFNDGRVAELKQMIKTLTIVEAQKDKSSIGMGSKIEVESKGKKREFQIVSFNEADPMSGKISNESPLGSAFLGKKKGNTVKVETPRGLTEYKVISIL